MKSIRYLPILLILHSNVNSINVNRLMETEIHGESIPDYYDSTSKHHGPNAEAIPERYKGTVVNPNLSALNSYSPNGDATMNTLIRYYGSQELKKCNDKEAKDDESETDWKKPINFIGEFADCGKPTGKVLLKKKEGLAAGREAVRTYYQFEGKKLDDFCKENVDPAWEHFDIKKMVLLILKEVHSF